jgi:FtsP/CotA-like multicopper oxidase with cupredoxin domain
MLRFSETHVWQTEQPACPIASLVPARPHRARPFDVTAPIVLGSHPGFHEGALELMHTINGLASPEDPPDNVREGQIVHLHIVIETGEYHPMQVHGHVFSLLAKTGEPMQSSPLHRDNRLRPHRPA